MELITGLEIVAMALSLAYVALAAKESVWCWPPAFIGTAIYAFITWKSSLVGESLLNVFYMLMAVYGWWQWRFPSAKGKFLPIVEWDIRWHLGIIIGGLSMSFALGWAFQHWLASAMPFLDAVTTVFSLIATYMVARKVLSNWIYWIVIDVLNVYLYSSRDLHITSALFTLYTFLAIWGYLRWRKTWRTNLAS